VNRTEIKGFNQNNFERGWALLSEEGKVKNVCANCGGFGKCEQGYWDGKPCPEQITLEKVKDF
jgi:hypothetical protein